MSKEQCYTRTLGTFLTGCSRIGTILEEKTTCLSLKGGKLRAAVPVYQESLKKLLTVGVREVCTMILPLSDENGHLITRATALETREVDLVCISLQSASSDVVTELPNLEHLFDLTATEASIVQDLFAGKTPQAIAEEHQNSIHTIRAHIRRCYDKLGISSREELWHNLNAYRVF